MKTSIYADAKQEIVLTNMLTCTPVCMIMCTLKLAHKVKKKVRHYFTPDLMPS